MTDKRGLSPLWKTVIFSVVAFAGGVVIFNFAIMPFLAGHGEEVRVPDLALRTVPEAERMLREQGLRLEATYPVFSPDVPKGCVISQTPSPLSFVKKNRGVKVRVSSGETGVAVPDLRGQSLRHAELVLSRAGLQLGRVSQVFSEDGSADAVLSSFPGAGALVEEGGSVDLLVSLGPRPAEYLMPRIVGADIAAATRALEAAGLTVEVASGFSRGTRIVKQNPPYGAKVAKGTKVVVELGSL
ncbi:MAG: PASTA domain-containing protein [Candidatus Eisenbacteria bacterium]|nr:PASTA domain-containing protein [Candidatus Eisenbacteria bacterium]